MERREVLKLGTVVGASAAASGCAPVLDALAPPALAAALAEVQDFLGRVDGTLDVIGRADGLQDFLPPGGLPDSAQTRAADGLFRSSVRSLLLVGSFSDLSQDARAHPAVQDRMWSAMPELDQTVAGMTRLLEQVKPTERATLSRMIREDPGFPMRVAEGLDAEARRYSVPLERRVHLRALTAHVSGRMKQSSGMLFDEYTTKARKLASHPGDLAEVERRLSAQLGATAFAHLRTQTLASAARWETGTRAPELPSPPFSSEELERRKRRTIRDGAIVLGVSGLVAGVSGLLIATQASLAVGLGGLTVGAILLITGLIVILYGAGMPNG